MFYCYDADVIMEATINAGQLILRSEPDIIWPDIAQKLIRNPDILYPAIVYPAIQYLARYPARY